MQQKTNHQLVEPKKTKVFEIQDSKLELCISQTTSNLIRLLYIICYLICIHNQKLQSAISYIYYIYISSSKTKCKFFLFMDLSNLSSCHFVNLLSFINH